MNYRMPVCKAVYIPVKYNSLPDQLRIIQVVAALYIIANIISDDYPVGVTGKIYVGQNIHKDYNSTKILPLPFMLLRTFCRIWLQDNVKSMSHS